MIPCKHNITSLYLVIHRMDTIVNKESRVNKSLKNKTIICLMLFCVRHISAYVVQ